MRGRRPLPTALHKLHGEPGRGRRPRNALEPKPDLVDASEPPAHLDAEAQAEWRRIVPVLTGMRVLAASDLPLLESWCVARSCFISASRELQVTGLIGPDCEGTTRRTPAYLIRNAAMGQIRQLAAEFGLSPSSRGRVNVMPAAQHFAITAANADRPGMSLNEYLARRPPRPGEKRH